MNELVAVEANLTYEITAVSANVDYVADRVDDCVNQIQEMKNDLRRMIYDTATQVVMEHLDYIRNSISDEEFETNLQILMNESGG